MSEFVDEKARDQNAETSAFVRELAVDYWGPDRTNGRRSQIAEHESRLDSLEERVAHYIDAERKRTCYGLEEFARRDQEAVEEIEEDAEVEAARVQAAGTVQAARTAAGATIEAAKKGANSATLVQLLTLAGVGLMAASQIISAILAVRGGH
jgi:hypothetical protein